MLELVNIVVDKVIVFVSEMSVAGFGFDFEDFYANVVEENVKYFGSQDKDVA